MRNTGLTILATLFAATVSAAAADRPVIRVRPADAQPAAQAPRAGRAVPVAAASATIINLGTLGGLDSAAYGINDAGQVVGKVSTADGNERAFLYSNGVMTDLGTLGGTYSAAYGINDTGQVVGYATMAGDEDARAFLSSNGVMTNLGTLGGSYSVASGINDSGQVVGHSAVAGGQFHAFLYSNGVMADLGTLGGSTSYATGINDSGQVVGSATAAGGYSHAFLSSNGVMADLGTPSGFFNFSHGVAVNNLGQVVGDVGYAGYLFYAFTLNHSMFVYSSGMTTQLRTKLGSVGFSSSLNDSGHIVGSARQRDYTYRAFLYANGTFTDLNDLLPPDSGWILEDATDINSSGAIAGNGTINGETRAFLLTPTPAGQEQP